MPAGQNTTARERLPICSDRFIATLDVPAAVASSVRHLFADELRENVDPCGHLIEVSDDGRVSMDGRRWEPEAGQSLFDQLVYVLMQASLDEDAERLHLHAALVAAEGRSMIIGGVSGSGKSTLVAELVADGFDYFTDERIAVDTDLSLAPLSKPVSVAYASTGPLQHLAPIAERTSGAAHRLWHLPASSIRAGSMGTAVPPLGAVVLVEYRDGASLETAALHPVTVARVLLTDCLDVDRFGPQGPMLVASLCASVPCLSAVHGGGSEVREFLRDALRDSVQSSVQPYEVLPVEGGRRAAWKGAVRFSETSVVGRARGVHGAVVADRALLRTAAGSVVELDEALTAWFLLLDGTASLREIVTEVAAETGMDSSALLSNAIAIVEYLAAQGVAA